MTNPLTLIITCADCAGERLVTLMPLSLLALCMMRNCLDCEESGQFLATGSPIAVGVQVSQTFCLPHLIPECKFKQPIVIVSLPVLSLTDSHTDDWIKILFEHLESPLIAEILDGQLLAQVTPCTIPVLLVLSPNHREIIQFNIISPLVLGHP